MRSCAQGMVRRFVDDRELWVGAVEAVAELDALMSLAAHAINAEGAVCRPRLVAPSQQQGQPPVFEAKGLRHPSGVCAQRRTCTLRVCLCVCGCVHAWACMCVLCVLACYVSMCWSIMK